MSSKECIKLTQEDREILQKIHDTLEAEIFRAENKFVKIMESYLISARHHIMLTQNNVLFGLWGVIYTFLILIGLFQAKSSIAYAVYVIITVFFAIIIHLIYRGLDRYQRAIDSFMEKIWDSNKELWYSTVKFLEIRVDYIDNARKNIIGKYNLDRLCPSDKVLVELVNNQLRILIGYIVGLKEISKDLKKKE